MQPFVILFTVPLGVIGAFLALFVEGQPVNVVVMIGLVMLGGIVVNNAIVLIDAVNQLRAEGLARREALRQAGLRRMRPILMTTGTTVLGLLPMALGLGEGGELRAPLATTVIGGLTVATLLTLVAIPVVYDLVERWREPATVPVPAAEPAGKEATLRAGRDRLRPILIERLAIWEDLAQKLLAWKHPDDVIRLAENTAHNHRVPCGD